MTLRLLCLSSLLGIAELVASEVVILIFLIVIRVVLRSRCAIKVLLVIIIDVSVPDHHSLVVSSTRHHESVISSELDSSHVATVAVIFIVLCLFLNTGVLKELDLAEIVSRSQEGSIA